jgi:hypothetical protein
MPNLPRKANSCGQQADCRELRANTVRGLEQDLLQRPGQVAVPHQGRRGQRMVVQVGPSPFFAAASTLTPRCGPG